MGGAYLILSFLFLLLLHVGTCGSRVGFRELGRARWVSRYVYRGSKSLLALFWKSEIQGRKQILVTSFERKY